MICSTIVIILIVETVDQFTGKLRCSCCYARFLKLRRLRPTLKPTLLAPPTNPWARNECKWSAMNSTYECQLRLIPFRIIPIPFRFIPVLPFINYISNNLNLNLKQIVQRPFFLFNCTKLTKSYKKGSYLMGWNLIDAIPSLVLSRWMIRHS